MESNKYESTSNGSFLLKWLMGIFASLVLAVVGYIHARLTNAEVILASRGERIATLESRAQVAQRDFDVISTRLIRIEDKIDSFTGNRRTVDK